MRRSFISGLAAAMFISGLGAAAARADVTDAQVTAAIKAGVQYLYGIQKQWGNWEKQNVAPKPGEGAGHQEGQYGGWTALVLDALLATGEEYQGNPKLQKGLDFMTKLDPPGTYATGLRAHVWPQLPDQFLEFLKTDAYRLMEALSDNGTYRYPLKKQDDWDNSCTQYGILGLWECQKRGVPVSQSSWQRAEKHFMDTQNADGGWGYAKSNDKSTMNMTAAGLACLYITEDYLHASEFVRPGVTENHPVHKRIEMGVKWFDQNFQPAASNAYGMVGVERVGVASGRKYFKNEDWYRVGATAFVGAQAGGGAIPGSNGEDVNTAFALIFLSRGRVPVFVNKLEIVGYPWNNRPRDVANLTAWASNELEIHMNWQVVGIDRPAAEWMDAPLLYLSGHTPLTLTDEQIAKLKEYLDMGGLLVVNADAASKQFVESVTQIFEKVYPYKFKPLASNDTLLDLVYPIKGVDAMVLDNGVRHLIVILTHDPAAGWQVDNQRGDTASYQLMGNIFEYAIEKTQPRNRLEIHTETKTGSSANGVYVGRARYTGNWNPEPLAWRYQNYFDNNQSKADPKMLTYDMKDIGEADVSMIHVVGTADTKFTDDDIKGIQAFVAKGGIILFETAGGQPAFSDSVRQMLAKAFPNNPIRRLSPASPIINGSGIDNAFNNSLVDYRVYYKQRLGISTQPALQAISFDDQPRVIISAEDMSNAMLGQPVWGIFGYGTQSARQLMTNIMLYAKKVHPAEGKDEKSDEFKAAEEAKKKAAAEAQKKAAEKPAETKPDAKPAPKVPAPVKPN